MAPTPVEKRLALVVEDDSVFRKAIARELSRSYEVVAVASMSEALVELDRGREIRVLVTDYELWDGHTGVEILERARRTTPSAVRVLVSSRVDGPLEHALNDAGLTHACVRKPWMPGTLCAMLTRAEQPDTFAAQLARGTEPGAPASAQSLIASELARGTESGQPMPDQGATDSQVPAGAEPGRAMAPMSWPAVRSEPRLPCHLPLSIRVPGSSSFRRGIAVNLSKGGLMCAFDRPAEVDQLIEIVMYTPGGQRLYLPARVRHVVAHGVGDPLAGMYSQTLATEDQLFRVGLQFESLDETQQQLVDDALAALSEAAGYSLG